MSQRKKFKYLESYIDIDDASSNRFIPLTLMDVEEEERRLEFKFPEQLREFYLNIGFGVFRHTHDRKIVQDCHANRLMDPTSVADIYLLGYESGQILPSVKFKPGYLPFFEVGDGDVFFSLRPTDVDPNVVYGMFGEIVAPSFEKFIWRLYYESPTFYMKDWGKEESS